MGSTAWKLDAKRSIWLVFCQQKLNLIYMILKGKSGQNQGENYSL